MEDERLVAIILLPASLLYYTLTTLLFFHYRHDHPISDRSSKLSLCRAVLLNAASTLLLLHMYLPSSSERLWLLSLFIGLVPASLLLLMRTTALTLRLALTAASDEVGEASSNGTSIDNEAQRQSVDSLAIDGSPQPRPSTSITLDEAPAAAGSTDSSDEGKEKDEPTVAWLLPYRWMVEGSFLTCLFSPLLVLSLVGLLLLLLLDHIDTSPASPAVIAVYALGHVMLFAHLMLLLACCVRYPAWNELRAEGSVSVLCALLLPASFGLSIASSTTSSTSVASDYSMASQYSLLAFYLLTFTSSILFPLLSSRLPAAYLSSSGPVPLQTFVDLIHTSEGYNSFLTFLRTEFSEENLFFWKDVNALHDKWREWEELEERRWRREEKDREKREASDAVTAIQQQPATASADSTGLLSGFTPAVNKPLLSSRMTTGLDSMSSQSDSTVVQGCESPLSRSTSQAASPKSRSRRARNRSVERAGRASKKARHTMQPSGSSEALAARMSEAISPRSSSENGRRVVHVHSGLTSALPGSLVNDVFLLPASQRSTSYSISVSPNQPLPGTSNPGHMRQMLGSQPPGLTLHPSSIHPVMPSAHQREGSTSYMMPYPLDDGWDADAISKLRRISWSIALEKKAARHRATRSRDFNSKHSQHTIRSAADSAHGTAAGRKERVYGASFSMSPQSHTPRRLSHPTPLHMPLSPIAQSTFGTPASSPGHVVPAEPLSSSPRLTAAIISPTTPTAMSLVSVPSGAAIAGAPSPTAQPSLPTPHSPHSQRAFPPTPQSPSVLKSPFMQSIVRALQATKLTSQNRREDDERKRDEERRPVLMGELLRNACDVYDSYVVAGSVQQVNLPAVIVQQVMERMKEINPLKYSRPRPNTSNTGNGRRGNSGMAGHNGMQHTLGLMRYATLHFLAAGVKGKVHPLLAAKQAKAEEEARKRRVLEDAAMLNDITLLSYPFSSLFADAHHAIEQLMEKDSFKRYLQSPAYDAFSIAYDAHHSALTARGRRQTRFVATSGLTYSSSRRGSRLAVITPRTSNRVGDIEEGSEEGVAGCVTARTDGVVARRPSDSVSLQLHIRASPREQRGGSLSFANNSPRATQLSPRIVRRPLPINTARNMTPRSVRIAGTASPRYGVDSVVMAGGGRSMEVRRGSGLRESEMGLPAAESVPEADAADTGSSMSISVV